MSHYKRRRVAYIEQLRRERGKASDYIGHAAQQLGPGDRIVLCCRVSACEQNRNGNLDDSEANLRRRAEALGVCVVGSYRHVGSGYDPWWVGRAAAMASELRAKLFAESPDRFIRSPKYSKTSQDAQAREVDLRYLAWWANGVPLVTDLEPDATPSETRSYQRKRGQRLKGKPGGRPRILDDRRALARAVGKLMRTLPRHGSGGGNG